jgi:hypothetical protein
MANFELNLARWVPEGFQTIDGGPTRLPCTFYTPAVAPSRSHNTYYIAIVEPPQPPELEQHLRQQVRNFLEQDLNRVVDDAQPCLFSVGMFQLRSAASCYALVQHGPYELHQDLFVRFVMHDDRSQIHRSTQGFRRGWLRFLGIPLDYRNDQDIANVVSTFGRFHHWHHIDGALDRTLVYVSFPSPALVPRDIVFGHYSNLGAVRESWTALYYILSADFAEVLPADEDLMLLDRNPHPLHGQMLHNLGNFVLPAYPELGWNDAPFMQHDGQPEEDI